MLAQVVDAILVVHAAHAILDHDLVQRTQAVFHDHHGHLIAVIHLVKGKAQAIGVNLPAPLARLEVRVDAATHDVAFSLSAGRRACQ